MAYIHFFLKLKPYLQPAVWFRVLFLIFASVALYMTVTFSDSTEVKCFINGVYVKSSSVIKYPFDEITPLTAGCHNPTLFFDQNSNVTQPLDVFLTTCS